MVECLFSTTPRGDRSYRHAEEQEEEEEEGTRRRRSFNVSRMLNHSSLPTCLSRCSRSWILSFISFPCPVNPHHFRSAGSHTIQWRVY